MKDERNFTDRNKKRSGYDRRPPMKKAEPNPNAVAGRNAVRELLASGRDIEKIYIQKGDKEGSILKLIGEASARKIPLVETEKNKLSEICGDLTHQGIVAVTPEHDYATVEDILSYADSLGEKPFVVICDGVEDPHNLGAILRSAECMGAHGVILPKRRSVGLTSVVAKTSAGAVEHIRVAKVPNLTQTMEVLKERGLWFYAADMDGVPYDTADLSGAVGLVLGSEGEGISRLVKEHCDFTLSIPMYGHVESMNVSCAAAVLLSEAARQRHKA